MNTPFEAIRIFETAARHLSFATAALELNVTASAVSQRMKALEVNLGVHLFQRLPNGLQLTNAGRDYLLDVRPAIQRLQAATKRASFVAPSNATAVERIVSLSTTPSIANLCVIPHFGSFRRNFPGVSLKLETSISLSKPTGSSLDYCLRYGAGDWPNLTSDYLTDEALFPVCSREVQTHMGSNPSVSDLLRYPFLHALEPISWIEWMDNFGVSCASYNEVLKVTDSALAIYAAIGGAGIALGRSQLVRNEITNGRLVIPTQLSMRSPFQYYLTYPANNTRDPFLPELREWLRKEVFDLSK